MTRPHAHRFSAFRSVCRLTIHSLLGLLMAQVAGTFVAVAVADDLAPANYRGQPGARMDHWTFEKPETHSNGEVWLPEQTNGVPPGRMVIPDTTESTFWERTYGGRAGVWRVEGAFLDFIVPNVLDPRRPKAVIVQVTWWPTSDQIPVVDVTNGDNNQDFEVPENFPPDTTDLDDGWKHTRYHFWSDSCPSREVVRVQPPPGGVMYIDQVVIDTICLDVYSKPDDDDGGDGPDDDLPPDDDDLPDDLPDGPGGIEASDLRLIIVGLLIGLILALLLGRLLGFRRR